MPTLSTTSLPVSELLHNCSLPFSTHACPLLPTRRSLPASDAVPPLPVSSKDPLYSYLLASQLRQPLGSTRASRASVEALTGSNGGAAAAAGLAAAHVRSRHSSLSSPVHPGSQLGAPKGSWWAIKFDELTILRAVGEGSFGRVSPSCSAPAGWLLPRRASWPGLHALPTQRSTPASLQTGVCRRVARHACGCQTASGRRHQQAWERRRRRRRRHQPR